MNYKAYLSTSEFAHRTGLSVKALRVYGKSGLLTPESVDPTNGYRRYSPLQIETGRLIALLRGADMGLTEIAGLVAELPGNSTAASAKLALYSTQLTTTYVGRQALIRHIENILKREDLAMFKVQTRSVPERRGMSIIRRIHAKQTDAFVAEAKSVFSEHLGGTKPTSPFIAIFHGRVDDESDGPIEAFLGCPDDVLPSPTIGIRTEAAHEEAFTRITKAQWDFPAILAAYDAVACSAAMAASSGSELSCREVYIAEPDEIGADEEICDVAFPLA
jgi:DNA-binding transcriptional MerR regulator